MQGLFNTIIYKNWQFLCFFYLDKYIYVKCIYILYMERVCVFLYIAFHLNKFNVIKKIMLNVCELVMNKQYNK
jgi:hypothetical protein